MKGTIKAISEKNKSILFQEIETGEERWLKVSQTALPYAKKGLVEITMSGTTVIKISEEGKGSFHHQLSSCTSETYPSSEISREEIANRYEKKERAIVRQSCLKAAVELVCSKAIDLNQLFDFAVKMEDWVFRAET